MLSDQEKTWLHQAISAAIKATPDSVEAASVLLPLLNKITNQDEEQAVENRAKHEAQMQELRESLAGQIQSLKDELAAAREEIKRLGHELLLAREVE